MEEEAAYLLKLFNNAWFNKYHFKVIKKSYEFWIKYSKFHDTFNEKQNDLYKDIMIEISYRMKFLKANEQNECDKLEDQLIPKDILIDNANALLRLFEDIWWNRSHFKVIKLSEEFWFNNNKLYDSFSDEQQKLYLNITTASSYRRKFLTEKEDKQYTKWIDKLIPDNYFD